MISNEILLSNPSTTFGVGNYGNTPFDDLNGFSTTFMDAQQPFLDILPTDISSDHRDPLESNNIDQHFDDQDERIKRPPNCYMLFRSHIGRLTRGGEQRSLCSKLGELWNNLTPEEKHYWKEKAELVKKQHAIRYPNYRYRPKHKSRIQKLADQVDPRPSPRKRGRKPAKPPVVKSEQDAEFPEFSPSSSHNSSTTSSSPQSFGATGLTSVPHVPSPTTSFDPITRFNAYSQYSNEDMSASSFIDSAVNGAYATDESLSSLYECPVTEEHPIPVLSSNNDGSLTFVLNGQSLLSMNRERLYSDDLLPRPPSIKQTDNVYMSQLSDQSLFLDTFSDETSFYYSLPIFSSDEIVQFPSCSNGFDFNQLFE